MLEPGYGYIRVTQFQERTGEDLAKALKDLYKHKGELKGLVLDLRSDPGGLLNQAVAVSAAFLPKDALVVYTDGRTAGRADAPHREQGELLAPRRGLLHATCRRREEGADGRAGQRRHGSASEIVAGALQDHKRATVIGTQTFGKGSVQTILPLGNNAGLKLTTARYYTPAGRSIQAKGIEPDIVVDDGRDRRNRIREANLERHLETQQGRAPPRRRRREAPSRAGAGKTGDVNKAEIGAGCAALRVRRQRRLPAAAGDEPAEGPAGDRVDQGRRREQRSADGGRSRSSRSRRVRDNARRRRAFSLGDVSGYRVDDRCADAS